MDKIQILAVAYAQTKLAEFQIEHREAVAVGNVDFSNDEIDYLKSAYDFAINHLE